VRPLVEHSCPCGRLISMDNRENDPLHAAINAKLAEIAAASSPPPAWYEAWSRLGPESPEEQRLTVAAPPSTESRSPSRRTGACMTGRSAAGCRSQSL